jgi:starch synthase
MEKLRVLYLASEIQPFLKITDVADYVRQIPQVMQEKGMEIRILVPRFGLINERKNRLHEVVRLSGINISVGDEEKPLVIKVASIPNAKLQVYFIDNDDYYHRKAALMDKDDRFFADNDERAIFFCKGALETVKKLGWSPDIVHCHDWLTGLVPLYLKTTYRKDPVFRNTKSVFSVYNNFFGHKFTPDLLDKVKMVDVEEDMLAPLMSTDFAGFVRMGMEYSDLIVQGEEPQHESVKQLFKEFETKKEIINVVENHEEFADLYCNLYNETVSVS